VGRGLIFIWLFNTCQSLDLHSLLYLLFINWACATSGGPHVHTSPEGLSCRMRLSGGPCTLLRIGSQSMFETDILCKQTLFVTLAGTTQLRWIHPWSSHSCVQDLEVELRSVHPLYSKARSGDFSS
jgi:hypothetical protein